MQIVPVFIVWDCECYGAIAESSGKGYSAYLPLLYLGAPVHNTSI